MNEDLDLIEIQGTAEDTPFSKTELNDMLEMGSSAIAEIIKKQKACIESYIKVFQIGRAHV